MLVSTVIPTYNYARFVGRAIESVLAQTYPQIECVVVDDGSTDDTAHVLARYGERIRVIRQENRGLSAARNTGITAARGEAIALLDADDQWRPGKIAAQVALLQREPDLGVVGCGTTVYDANGEPRREILWQSPGAAGTTAQRQIAMRRAWVGGSGSGALIRRSVFADVGLFDEGLRAAEDLDMWLRVGARHRIQNIVSPLTIIHQHGTGSFRNAAKMQSGQEAVYELAALRWPEVFDERTQRRIKALVAIDAAMELTQAGRHRQAVGRCVDSIRAWPFDAMPWRRAARGVLKLVGI